MNASVSLNSRDFSPTNISPPDTLTPASVMTPKHILKHILLTPRDDIEAALPHAGHALADVSLAHSSQCSRGPLMSFSGDYLGPTHGPESRQCFSGDMGNSTDILNGIPLPGGTQEVPHQKSSRPGISRDREITNSSQISNGVCC